MGEYILDPDPIFAPDFLEKLSYSAHALIVSNGDVMICRDEAEGAIHARGFNTNSLGVEFLVQGDHNYASFLEAIKTDWVTPAQWKSGIELIQEWKSRHNIREIVRHSDISPGRKVDPGAGFDWIKFVSECN